MQPRATWLLWVDVQGPVLNQLDHAHQAADVSPGLAAALCMFNEQVEDPLAMATALGLKQRALTDLVDQTSWRRHLEGATVVSQAVLRSEAEPGARALLIAVPSGKTRMEAAISVTELRQRLGVLDKFSHHAAVCCAGGERTTRHHALRDALCVWADRAGLQPEKEKPGLLIPQRPDDTTSAKRRPADLFVPSYLGSPTAFDLAVTAPSRQETLGEAARNSLAAASAYAVAKRVHLDTAAACHQQGLTFEPLVVETTGAWEPAAAAFLRQVAKAAAAREGGQMDLHSELLQELSVITRTFRARAILRRRIELALASSSCSPL